MATVYEFPGWRAHLQKGERQQTLASAANAVILVDCEQRLRNIFAYDELAARTICLRAPPPGHDAMPEPPGPYPRPMTDIDATLVLAFLQRTENSGFTRPQVESAISVVSQAHAFHPIREYLDGLAWDGKPRLQLWLQAAFSSPDNPYTRAVGTIMLIASVRRIRQPGCKYDCVPILQGPQGIKKSTSLRVLYEPWFTDMLPADLSSKDAALGIAGVWCVELSEIDHLIRSDIETVKAFCSRQVDRYRPPYGRITIEVPRQSCMIGSTNSDDYLRDSTGNRRFLPIDTPRADPVWLGLNRDQLWAEASRLEADGAPHWLEGEADTDAEQEQENRLLEDVWLQPLKIWLHGKLGPFTTWDALLSGLQLPTERHGARETRRVSACLRRLGWKQVRSGRGCTARREWLPDPGEIRRNPSE